MREILFRGKCGYQWYYGNLVKTDDEFSEYRIVNKNNKNGYLVGSKTIGQYIGLEDDNGTHTFEGDIIQYHYDSNPVFFDASISGFNVKDYYDSNQDDSTAAFSENLKFVIIGSIHDNTES